MPGPILKDPGPLRASLYDKAEVAPLQQEAEKRAIEANPEHQALLTSTKRVIPRPRRPVGTPVFASDEDFARAQREAASLADTTPLNPAVPYRPGFRAAETLRTPPTAQRQGSAVLASYHPSIPRTDAFDFNTFANRLVVQESGGKSNARNPRSSAFGKHQFLESTFVDTVKRHHPNLAKGKTDKQIAALRSDDETASKVFESFSRENKAILDRNKVPISYGTMYAAHFAGPDTAAKLYSADPSSDVSEYFSPAAIEANPHLKGMKVADFWKWAAGAMRR